MIEIVKRLIAAGRGTVARDLAFSVLD